MIGVSHVTCMAVRPEVIMDDKNRETLRSLVAEFHTGMLVTKAPEGLRARPMSVAKLETNDDLFFAASVDSGKVKEIEDDHEVVVTFQSKTAYVSLSGPARAVTDPAVIAKYWSEPMRVWFPKGPTDPSLCLIQMRPAQGEFWNVEGAKGLRYIFEAAKAYVTGTTPKTAPDQHGEVGDVASH